MPATRTLERPSLGLLLDEQRHLLDELAGEVELGVRGARHYDELEERAQAIARAIGAAFREGRR